MFSNIKISFKKNNKIKKITKYVIILVAGCFLIYYILLPVNIFDKPVCTVITDPNGFMIGAHIAGDGQWRFPYNQKVPEKFRQAIIQFEDKRFFSHIGIDFLAIGRAIKLNLGNQKVVSGASTLTMQVVRISRQNKNRTILEKIIEIIQATKLELFLTKNKILSLYASNAPFGGNVVGLDAASWRYFGCSPEQLTWSQSATLAVLPNSPALIHPGRNRKQLLEKRNKLLAKLFTKKIINEQTYTNAIKEPLPDKPKEFPQIAPHLLMRIKKEQNPVSIIKTTLNINYQTQANQIIQRHYKNLKSNDIHNLAIFVIENKTNRVLVYAANSTGDSTKSAENDVDMIMANRSTGSILKPFLYAIMLTKGEILQQTLVPDIPVNINGYMPVNYNKGYEGAITADKALARSLNIPAVKMLQNFGIERFHYILQKIGLRSIVYPANHYGLSLILGGCEANLWDLTSTYSSMARTLIHYQDFSGKYMKSDFSYPIIIDTVVQTHKIKPNDLLEDSWFSASAIYFTFKAMLTVERPEEETNWEMFSSSRKIAWKTGTSFGFRDAWAIGVTPEFTVGVWVGNADGEGRPNLIGIKAAAPVLFDMFSVLPQFNSWFSIPFDDMIKTAVCRQSGYLATENCEYPDTILIPKQGQNSESCPYHKIIHLDKTLQWQVNSDCEQTNNMVHLKWFVLPPAMESYYKIKHPEYKELPLFRYDCITNTTGNNSRTMEIIYPNLSAKIYIPIEIDGKTGQTVFEAAHRNSDATMFWYIDNQYIGSTKRLHKISLNPKRGKHLLTITDDKGEKITREFEIINKTN